MSEALISEYLGRLDAAAWPLSPSRRTELVSEVREHIETALDDAGSRDEATLRNVLDRLGRPEDIVAAEVQAGGGDRETDWHAASQPQPGILARAEAQGWGPIEIAAVLLLMAGTLLLWWAGPVAGAVTAWFSGRWTTREKQLTSFVVFGLLAVQAVLMMVTFAGAFGGMGSGIGELGFGGFGSTFGNFGVFAVLSMVLPFVAGLGAGLYLALAISRRY